MRFKLPIVCALAILAAPSAAGQEPTSPEAAAAAWLDLVAGGLGGVSWHQADPYFQHRVLESSWESWVTAQRGRLPGGRRLLESSTGRNETADPPVEWAIYVFGSDRPAGGRIIQRVAVAREGEGDWTVYDYGVWPDPAAIVANAAIDPIPYGSIPLYRGGFRLIPPGHPGRPSSPAAAAPRGRNVANPRTAPRRPSPGP